MPSGVAIILAGSPFVITLFLTPASSMRSRGSAVVISDLISPPAAAATCSTAPMPSAAAPSAYFGGLAGSLCNLHATSAATSPPTAIAIGTP